MWPQHQRKVQLMTEWKASEYDRVSALGAIAEEAQSLLDLRGTESVLDIGRLGAYEMLSPA